MANSRTERSRLTSHPTDQPANTGKILRNFFLLGGLAHGASLHHELQLLVAAALQPEDALRAATSIVLGALADLLLVDGDPAATISDTLSIGKLWRRGVRQAAA